MIDPAKPVCGNCAHRGKNDSGQMECWRHPPLASAAPLVAGPVMAGGPPKVNWLIQAYRPPVRETGTCGEFEPAASIVN